ncbi:MAG: F0F1 ATP synthase subunit B [Bacteroidia bacterium]|nr:F0F1 ATP synthase subunit B [Bacteroidia bacterium]
MSLITPDFGLIFWMTLIFAILLFLLAKFGFPVITKSVRERSEHIDESLRKAQEAEQRLSSLADEQKVLIKQSQAEQSRILKEAAATRDAMIAQARSDARSEADKILADARLQIAAEKESALRGIRREVAVLSVSVAEKILRKDLSSDAAGMELVEKMVGEAKTHKTS